MDFEEDSFASAPIRYALDDHDSDEEVEASLQVKKVNIQANITLPDSSSTKYTVVFGLEGPGNVYLQSLNNLSATVVGTVTRIEEENKTTTANVGLLKTNGPDILIIPIIEHISDEEAGSFVRAIFNTSFSVERVVVLDAFTATGYISKTYDENRVPPYLRVLQTSNAPVLNNVNLFETPNTIKGLPAAILNYCEIYSIPCYDFLTLQESVYGQLLVTAEILEAYTEGFKKLGFSSFSVNELVMTQVLETQRKGRVNDSHHRLYL